LHEQRFEGDNVQLGMIGLGRMGGNIVRRLMRHGHTSVVYDANPDSVTQLAHKVPPPATIWPRWWRSWTSRAPCG